ncbi:transposase [Modicisalibacter luteus]|uniref:Transposase n=1 Tax=Modicisalibacter luteus TaxID=453962 RepID=A0ABV7M1F6_9GAMM|nr:transposase [Halomonas lutea]GHB12590.1 hypothetical protein GCM10007159_38450 [Halomonas lutea]
MSRKRRQYSSDFKAKVALAALKGDQTTSEIAARFEIHPTMVSQWKRELLDNATGVPLPSLPNRAKVHRPATNSVPRNRYNPKAHRSISVPQVFARSSRR